LASAGFRPSQNGSEYYGEILGDPGEFSPLSGALVEKANQAMGKVREFRHITSHPSDAGWISLGATNKINNAFSVSPESGDWVPTHEVFRTTAAHMGLRPLWSVELNLRTWPCLRCARRYL
jgi:hypothetical protein